jgi:hypothetical protein
LVHHGNPVMKTVHDSHSFMLKGGSVLVFMKMFKLVMPSFSKPFLGFSDIVWSWKSVYLTNLGKCVHFFKTVLGGNVLIFKYCSYKENVQDMKTVHVFYFCSVEIVQGWNHETIIFICCLFIMQIYSCNRLGGVCFSFSKCSRWHCVSFSNFVRTQKQFKEQNRSK